MQHIWGRQEMHTEFCWKPYREESTQKTYVQMGEKEIRWECMNWICLTEGRDQ
jgi:hypothetical protein